MLDKLSLECPWDQLACSGAASGSESRQNLRQPQTKSQYWLSAFPSTYENEKPHNENEHLVKFTSKHKWHQSLQGQDWRCKSPGSKWILEGALVQSGKEPPAPGPQHRSRTG